MYTGRNVSLVTNRLLDDQVHDETRGKSMIEVVLHLAERKCLSVVTSVFHDGCAFEPARTLDPFFSIKKNGAPTQA